MASQKLVLGAKDVYKTIKSKNLKKRLFCLWHLN